MGALSIFSVISWSIYKILVPILVQISWIFQNTPSFSNFDVFEWSYAENGPIWATPENLPFFKNENHLFSYSYVSKVPKWNCAYILLCKKYKNSLKLLNIADIQPPVWIQRKKHPVFTVTKWWSGMTSSPNSALVLRCILKAHKLSKLLASNFLTWTQQTDRQTTIFGHKASHKEKAKVIL